MSATDTDTKIRIVPTSAPVGAEIRGVDLSGEIDAATFAAVKRASETHGVIFFRNQALTPEQHLAFSRHFGELEMPVLNQYTLPGYPAFMVISNIKEHGRNIGVADAGAFWHSDASYKAIPTMYSLLYSIEIPIEHGRPLGDTHFVSTERAYDALPEHMKRRLQNLRAVHRLSHGYSTRYDKSESEGGGKRDPLTAEQLRQTPDVIHPVVRTHPTTGRKCLYVNEGLTAGFVGMDEKESSLLLRELCDLLQAEEQLYRHHWRAGDLVVWDNCSTQHRATFDYSWPRHRRLMRRSNVVGTRPV